MFGLSVLPFLDPRIKYFNRSLAISAPFKVKLKAIIDPHTLQKITKKCDSMYMGQVYKAAFLLSFVSFLRISNLVPHATTKFNQMKQLARGDVFFAPPGAHILIKWSKTLQTRDSVKIIKIPSLGSSPVCPVKALHTLLAITPGDRNKPLFQIKKSTKWLPLTDSRLRKNLALILASLQLQDSNITFHAFRRSGATLAFNSSVPLQDIQSQGTWTSEWVWRYITQDHNASDRVASAFASLLSS